MLNNLVIREVNAKNPKVREALVTMHEECFSDSHAKLFDQGYWWIAYHDNIPVAFCGMNPSSRWSDCGYFCRAGVRPSHEGHGIQKRMIRVRINKARKLGWNWVITDTRKNPPSANSLISMGFKMFQPSKPWSFRDALYWRKKI